MFTQDRVKFDEDLTELINIAAANASSSVNSPRTELATPSPSVDPRLHDRASCERRATKRVKLEHTSDNDALVRGNVHPSRRGLLNAPSFALGSANGKPSPFSTTLSDDVLHLQTTGSNTVPLGNSMKRRADDLLDSQSVVRRESAVTYGSHGPISIGQDRVSNKNKHSVSTTLRNVVRRQWDPSRDRLPYEHLLENRRTEQLGKVDRYVPTSTLLPRTHRTAVKLRSSSPFPYRKLPEKVRAKILALLLVSHEPIVIDFVSQAPTLQMGRNAFDPCV